MEKRIHASQFRDLTSAASKAERGRAHLNTHDSLDADVQRLFIATSRDTYIRPHRHSEAHKWEFFVLIEGRMDLLIFDDAGTIVERCPLSPTDTRAVEIPPGQWHSYVCYQSGTLALEVKQGAYTPSDDNDLAPWAPEESSARSESFLGWMRTAPVGSAPAKPYSAADVPQRRAKVTSAHSVRQLVYEEWRHVVKRRKLRRYLLVCALAGLSAMAVMLLIS